MPDAPLRKSASVLRVAFLLNADCGTPSSGNLTLCREKLASIQSMFVQEALKRPTFFLCRSSGLRNVALMCREEFAEICPLEFLAHFHLPLLKAVFIGDMAPRQQRHGRPHTLGLLVLRQIKIVGFKHISSGHDHGTLNHTL